MLPNIKNTRKLKSFCELLFHRKPSSPSPNRQKFDDLLLLLFFLVLGFSSCNNPSGKNISATANDSTLPFYSDPSFTPHWLKDNDSLQYYQHTISAFSCINQAGDTVGSFQLRGKVYIAGFFFTACPGVCPKLINQLKRVQQVFANERDVRLVCFSVTPEIDSVKQLKKYAAHHGINAYKWWLLTGNRDSIYRLARRDFFADEDLGMQKGSNEFLHTENLLLIDREGHIRGVYKGTSPVDIDWLLKDIRQLLHP
jgi:protein SCO1/2